MASQRDRLGSKDRECTVGCTADELCGQSASSATAYEELKSKVKIVQMTRPQLARRQMTPLGLNKYNERKEVTEREGQVTHGHDPCASGRYGVL